MELKWVDRNDWLPKKCIRCLVYGRYSKDSPMSVFEAVYDPRGRKFRTDIIAKDVTHWMEMPEPPIALNHPNKA